jgi:FkbM family methyltransferase
MSRLSSGLAGVRLIHRRTTSVIRRYATGELTARDVVRIATRAARRTRWGGFLFDRSRLAALASADRANAVLRAENDALRGALLDTTELRRNLDAAAATIAHLRRVEVAYAQSVAEQERSVAAQEQSAARELQARDGVGAFVDALQGILFEVNQTTTQSRSAATLILGGKPIGEVMATLVNLSEPVQGARPFQYIVPFLAPRAPFPLVWPDGAEPLRIIDVGSQELSFETDMHAPLRLVAPMRVTGFDPFVAPSGTPDAVIKVKRADGGTISTHRCLLADGNTVTFHVNRFNPASSILPSNQALTEPFGLLGMALETVETRPMPSRRMDDVLSGDTPVDLLKIDVQGAAHIVLAHAAAVLRRTLVCHVEVEFAPVYLGERLFADIDILLREAGFSFVDFFSLGRQRYHGFDTARTRAFHRGRTLWADCIYVRGLDSPNVLSPDELFRAALIMHVCYNKQDLAAELLRRSDALTGGASHSAYMAGLAMEDAA